MQEVSHLSKESVTYGMAGFKMAVGHQSFSVHSSQMTAQHYRVPAMRPVTTYSQYTNQYACFLYE